MTDYQIRAAEAHDNQALIALERRSPLRVGDLALSFDRSPDYFAGSRLQERSLYAVAELADGRLAGVCASAVHPAMLLGKERLLSYTHHERIAPEFQRMGIGAALPRWLTDAWKAASVFPDRSYAYIDSQNTASLAFAAARGGPGPWPVNAWLQDLSATLATESEPLQELTESDADEVCALLNQTHQGLELFPGYTRQRLLSRLRRSAGYGWAQWRGIRRHGRLLAAAGLYDRGADVATTVRSITGEGVKTTRAMVVLDYGHLPGETGAMLALLDGFRGMAGAMGRDAVEISSAESRSLFQSVMDRTTNYIRFKFLGGALVPGDNPSGVFLDPVYL